MNKKTLITLAIVIVILIVGFLIWNLLLNKKDDNGCFVNKGYSWCEFDKKCIKEGEECVLNQEWVLNKAKEIIGLDLNTMPFQVVEWKEGEENIPVSALGIYYTDLLKSEKVMKGFEDWDGFLNEFGFQSDSSNEPVSSDKEDVRKYIKDKIVCELKRIDNTNGTSSLGLFCGNKDNTLCKFDADCARDCTVDSDCALTVNACDRKSVCRARGFQFFNDCDDPTANVSDLDTRIGECSCVENKCLPTKEELRDNN